MLSCKLPQKMHFGYMLLWHKILGDNNMRYFFNTKTTKMVLKKLLTCYLNVNHMIVWLTLEKAHNPHLDPSTTYHKINVQHFENMLMKILEKDSFNTSNFQLALWFVCQNKIVTCEYVLIIVNWIDLPLRTNTF
jgi:hypothetical protein